MAARSKIEWTESTWNPVTGCTKISPGCKNCYAERMSKRLQAMGQPNYVNGFEPVIHENMLNHPLKWKKPQRIFVNSMSDLFHEDIPDEFILKVFDVMKQAHWHWFQVLTKRAERLSALNHKLPWAENIWMGVTVENQDCVYRIEHLKRTNASVKFLSMEPLLTPINNLNLGGLDWIIVGGESGPGARPMEVEWVVDICNQSHEAGVPFFFKQWGGTRKKKNGRILNGRTWDGMPTEKTMGEISMVI